MVLGKGSPDLSCMRAGGMAGVPRTARAGGILWVPRGTLDTAGGSEYLRSGRG